MCDDDDKIITYCIASVHDPAPRARAGRGRRGLAIFFFFFKYSIMPCTMLRMLLLFASSVLLPQPAWSSQTTSVSDDLLLADAINSLPRSALVQVLLQNAAGHPGIMTASLQGCPRSQYQGAVRCWY